MELIDKFIKRVNEAAGNALYFENIEKALHYVADYLKTHNSVKIAVADFDAEELKSLRGKAKDIEIISNSLRTLNGDFKVGLTKSQYGIAETGTLVISSTNEDTRLASSLPDIHFALLKAENIVEKQTDLINYLKTEFTKKGNYTAFVTGPSRTADIERVLAIGAHGPVELHVLIYNN